MKYLFTNFRGMITLLDLDHKVLEVWNSESPETVTEEIAIRMQKLSSSEHNEAEQIEW